MSLPSAPRATIPPRAEGLARPRVKPIDVALLRMFAYGTLKRGGSNFERFCAGASRIDPAHVIGRLHFFPPHYPILDVPPEHVLGEATRRLSEDLARLGEIKAMAPPWAAGDWIRIRGELMEFEGGVELEQRLARIDWLEDFDVDEPSAYRRVIVAAERDDGVWLPAWSYVIPAQARGRYQLLEADVWTEQSRR